MVTYVQHANGILDVPCLCACVRVWTGAETQAHLGPPDLCVGVRKKPKTKSGLELVLGTLQKCLGCRKLKQCARWWGQRVEHNSLCRYEQIAQKEILGGATSLGCT